MKNENPIYSDLDLSFVPHPLTGDLSPKVNLDALKRSIRHLFQLNAFDIPFEPNLKSSLKHYLFETNDHINRAALKKDLVWIVQKLEPRIVLKELTVESTSDGLGFVITVTYANRSLNQEDSFSFTIEKVR